jgi:hypothetical protein
MLKINDLCHFPATYHLPPVTLQKIVQIFFKKVLTPPCDFEILASHTVTLKYNRIRKYEN